MTAALASLLLATIAWRCFWLWQPERQLLLHQASFRAALEKRDWNRVRDLMDTGYADRWGYTRDTGIHEARQYLGQFFALTINAQLVSDQLTATGGTVTERWQLDGTGTEIAGMIEQYANTAHEPFVFEWRHRSWEPWDWALVRVDNAELNLTAPDL
jgi:hypothetical protein